MAILLLKHEFILTHSIGESWHRTHRPSLFILIFVFYFFIHHNSRPDRHCSRCEQKRGIWLIVVHHRRTYARTDRSFAITSKAFTEQPRQFGISKGYKIQCFVWSKGWYTVWKSGYWLVDCFGLLKAHTFGASLAETLRSCKIHNR